MDLRLYLTALRKSWLVILLLTLLGAAAGYLAYALTTPVYASTVTFYVATPVAPNTNAQSAGQFAQDRVTSYVQLLQSDRLSGEAAAASGVPVEQVAGKITASAQASTVLVTATVTDTSATRAQQIGRGVAEAFPALVDTLDNAGRQTDVVSVNLTSGPDVSDGPVAPNLRLYLALGVVIGLLLGFVTAVARALLDQSVRSTDTAGNLVGAPVISTINLDPEAKKSPLIVGGAATSVRAEEFRRLRTSLKFIDAAHRTDVLLVTSATAQEGKSLTAVNLAISLAEDGQRVLLVDSDLRRPSAARLLGLESEIGVSNVLIEEVSAQEAIQEWGPHRLHFMASGHLPPNPAELLGGDRMAKLVGELRGEYDKIIIDSPPVLPVADAAVLATLADGALFVVRYGRTTRATVRAAARSLGDVGGRIVGTVLNMRRFAPGERANYTYTASRPVPVQSWPQERQA